MKTTFKVVTVKDLVELAVSGKLNPNPIGQRSAVSSGYTKSAGITHSCVNGYGIGMITVRFIGNDAAMQEVYPGVDYLVIDGGHRVRALRDFYMNKYRVDGKYFKNTDIDLTQISVPLDIKECTSREAIEIFRNVNETTHVNFMEMLMADDESKVCKEVRSLVRYIKEYDNETHDLFGITVNRKEEVTAKNFDGDPDPRAKWAQYVFIAIIKAAGGGNVDAGQTEIEKVVEDEKAGIVTASKSVMKVVNRFLDDVYDFQSNRSRKLNNDIFSALQVVWFALYEKNKNFKITDIELFHDRFMYAYSMFTGQSPSIYDGKTVVDEKGDEVSIKTFVRRNITNYSNSKLQRQCAVYLLEEMGEEIGVVFRDDKRTIPASEREEKLALQGYRCAIDGEPLKLEDSVWGHDTPWAKGGRLGDGAVIRRAHNVDMGSITIAEYRMILEMRKQKAA